MQTLELRPDVELIGRYEGSGRADERYLAKRADGAFVELTRLLYLTVAALDGHRNSTEVAEVVAAETGLDVTAENIEFLVEKLAPLGLITNEQAPKAQPDMVLGLRVKKAVVPVPWVRALTRPFQHLFHWPIVVLLLSGFGWALAETVRGGYLRSSVSQLITKPQVALVVIGLTLVALVFHELGHASACRFGGARPGAIGGGLYLMFPVLYTDVGDAYRLTRAGRVRTDLGGVYFNAVLCVVFGVAFSFTHYLPLVLALVTSVLLIAEQLWPVARYDLFWVISDLAGVPDLFPRLPAALRRRPRGQHGRADKVAPMTELKPYSRRIIRVWAVTTVIVLPIELMVVLLLSATLAVTFSLALADRFAQVPMDMAVNNTAAVALDLVQGLLLTLLLVGLVYGLCFLSLKIIRYAVRRFGVVIGMLALAVLAAPVLWSALTVRLVHQS